MSGQKQYVIAFGPCPWSGTWQRPQQILSRVSGLDRQVLYVNPPGKIGSRTLWRQVVRPGFMGSSLHVNSCLTTCSPDLSVLSLPPCQMYGQTHSNHIARINAACVSWYASRALDRIGFSRDKLVLWLTLPEHAFLPDHFADATVVYDCMDDHAGWGRGNNVRIVNEQERRLSTRAYHVFASSRALQEKLAGWGCKAGLVPNGVDYDRFTNASCITDDRLGLENVKRPIALYVGNVADWLDTDVLASLADSGECSVVLVGPVSTDIRALRSRPNVHILGMRPHYQIPSYIRASAVCLYPFRSSTLTKAVNPVKVWEYLALGRPVVAFDNGDLSAFECAIETVNGRDAFCSKVLEVLANPADYDSETRRLLRKSTARANDWSRRAEEVCRCLEEAKD